VNAILLRDDDAGMEKFCFRNYAPKKIYRVRRIPVGERGRADIGQK
jgi:hypothetical protein